MMTTTVILTVVSVWAVPAAMAWIAWEFEAERKISNLPRLLVDDSGFGPAMISLVGLAALWTRLAMEMI